MKVGGCCYRSLLLLLLLLLLLVVELLLSRCGASPRVADAEVGNSAAELAGRGLTGVAELCQSPCEGDPTGAATGTGGNRVGD